VLIDNQITEIPVNAFQGLRVKRVNLSGNKIRSISPRAFIELSNYLEELTIEFDSNSIHQIPDAIKINLINLRSLKLIDLNLSTIENRTFIKFRKLEQLTIRKSNIRSIESEAFFSLTNLRYLNLDQNQLTDSSWDFLVKYLPHLENLSLSQNNFHSLKTAHLKSLKYLDLSSNGLQSIDTNLFHSLEKVYLQNNELNSLQLTFLSSLKNLKELNFDFNRLTFLPEKIFQSNLKLIYLSLQGNDLNYLTNYSLFGLKNLIHLNLARNRLQFQINQRPFQDLNSLKILNLDRNSQINLTQNILEDLSRNFLELSLQNCNLTSWNYSLKFLSHLQRLKLSSNYLKNLPKDFLNPSIISVDLQRNFFTSIPDLFESNISKLTDLDLSSNQISTLQKNQLSNYPNLKTIGLTGNPLDCNCHLRWIKQWLEHNYDQDLIKFLQWTCAKPVNLFGKQLTAIHEQEMICQDEKEIESTTTTK
jgi:Leucine-rich repeat (LRR) protein